MMLIFAFSFHWQDMVVQKIQKCDYGQFSNCFFWNLLNTMFRFWGNSSTKVRIKSGLVIKSEVEETIISFRAKIFHERFSSRSFCPFPDFGRDARNSWPQKRWCLQNTYKWDVSALTEPAVAGSNLFAGHVPVLFLNTCYRIPIFRCKKLFFFFTKFGVFWQVSSYFRDSYPFSNVTETNLYFSFFFKPLGFFDFPKNREKFICLMKSLTITEKNWILFWAFW